MQNATADGLVAIGGDVTVDRLLVAYRQGIFPWPVFGDHLMTWFCPNPRAILELNALHVSKSLKKRIRRGEYTVTFNHAFESVIQACASPGPGRASTWITDQIRHAYVAMHRAGHAHSVETWHDGQLVGGLYGVAVGGQFAGESMFSRRSDASKVALVALVERLRQRGFVLLDVQQATDHMMRMGASQIPRDQFLARLRVAVEQPCRFD